VCTRTIGADKKRDTCFKCIEILLGLVLLVLVLVLVLFVVKVCWYTF